MSDAIDAPTIAVGEPWSRHLTAGEEVLLQADGSRRCALWAGFLCLAFFGSAVLFYWSLWLAETVEEACGLIEGTPCYKNYSASKFMVPVAAAFVAVGLVIIAGALSGLLRFAYAITDRRVLSTGWTWQRTVGAVPLAGARVKPGRLAISVENGGARLLMCVASRSRQQIIDCLEQQIRRLAK